ncbi:hypothetical protein GCM10022222_86490 [Amycolatopsis ultiminotia]|uniref:Uncharacterized protein n=1 Tax=Amycolatopsis ultiminotia TaxID=543629 RepID=A0ABP6YSV3_9PSEU
MGGETPHQRDDVAGDPDMTTGMPLSRSTIPRHRSNTPGPARTASKRVLHPTRQSGDAIPAPAGRQHQPNPRPGTPRPARDPARPGPPSNEFLPPTPHPTTGDV